MSQFSPQGFTSAPPSLKAWVHENSASGISSTQLLESMIKAGYDPVFAGAYLAQCLSPDASRKSDVLTPSEEVHCRAVATWWARHDTLLADGGISVSGDAHAAWLVAHAGVGLFYFPDLLTGQECQDLMALAREKLSHSCVVDPATGAFVPHAGRTSQGSYFRRHNAPDLVAKIQSRIAQLTGLPQENFEDLQVLRYAEGEEYRPHFDYFDPSLPGSVSQMRNGGQRLLTVICYLSPVDSGGGTSFPSLGLTCQPRQGAALVFASLDREGRPNASSLHAGLPVVQGEKFIVTQWIRCEAVS